MKIINKYKKDSGITLTSLIITIVVMLILAGTAIAIFNGDEGLIKKAEIAVKNHEISEEQEVIKNSYSTVLTKNELKDSEEEATAEQLEKEITRKGKDAGVNQDDTRLIIRFRKTQNVYYINILNGEIEYDGNYKKEYDNLKLIDAEINLSATPTEWTKDNVTVEITKAELKEDSPFDKSELELQYKNGNKKCNFICSMESCKQS